MLEVTDNVFCLSRSHCESLNVYDFFLNALLMNSFNGEPTCRGVIQLVVPFCFLWYFIGGINTFSALTLQDSPCINTFSTSLGCSLVFTHTRRDIGMHAHVNHQCV